MGAEDGFFLLGGHSLLATRLLARLRQELGVEVPIAELLGGASTVRAVAGLVARQRERAGAGAELLPALTRAPEAESYPTSFPQETVWFLDRLSPGNRAYHACAALRFRGQLQMAALGRALDLLVARHESFRSAFPEWQGRPRLVIHPHRPAWRLPLLDLSGLAPEDAERAQENAYARETRRPFCLTEPPLVRWRLLRRSADDHRLLQVEHHLVHDGWSFALLVADLVRLYPALAEGRNPAVTEPPRPNGLPTAITQSPTRGAEAPHST
ncbi:MAG TPA: condensation domain-containing protein [Thermoanaerobaculia bacterium]|nr:condensation domain-containing protein [Thermoanaerobaculia bacterium]